MLILAEGKIKRRVSFTSTIPKKKKDRASGVAKTGWSPQFL